MKKYILALLLCYAGTLYAQTEGAGKYAINKLTVNTKNSDLAIFCLSDSKNFCKLLKKINNISR